MSKLKPFKIAAEAWRYLLNRHRREFLCIQIDDLYTQGLITEAYPPGDAPADLS